MTICIHAHKHIHMKECICASMHLFTHACMYTAPSVSAVPMFVGGRTYVLPTTLHHISACVVRLLCLLLGMRGRRPLWVRQALHVKTLHSIKGPLQQQRGPFSGGTANSCRPRPKGSWLRCLLWGAQRTDAGTSGLGPLFPSPAPSLWPLAPLLR